jgi:hypothetical protein
VRYDYLLHFADDLVILTSCRRRSDALTLTKMEAATVIRNIEVAAIFQKVNY